MARDDSLLPSNSWLVYQKKDAADSGYVHFATTRRPIGTVLTDWNTVIAAGLALPGVERGAAYGKPALKLRGKVLAATTSPDPGSFVLRVAVEEKEGLIETDPVTFWETDHYRSWPAILVRYGTVATDRIVILLTRAWWDRATVAQRKVYGDRP